MQKTAGLLFFLGGSLVVLGIMTAEIFYPPGYNVSLNMISNLGSTPPPDSIIRQPSAAIFDYVMMLSGLLIFLGAYFLHVSKSDRSLILAIAVMGISAAGVGIFPAYHAIIHPLVALLTFFSGGIAAILSARLVTSPFRAIALLFGITGLTLLALGTLMPSVIVPIFGKGGTERWIAYPILLWLCGFGGYLMSIAPHKAGKHKV
jgi:hypothetical membrane protein